MCRAIMHLTCFKCVEKEAPRLWQRSRGATLQVETRRSLTQCAARAGLGYADAEDEAVMPAPRAISPLCRSRLTTSARLLHGLNRQTQTESSEECTSAEARRIPNNMATTMACCVVGRLGQKPARLCSCAKPRHQHGSTSGFSKGPCSPVTTARPAATRQSGERVVFDLRCTLQKTSCTGNYFRYIVHRQ